MNESQVGRLQEFYKRIEVKLEPLQVILSNLTNYLTNSVEKDDPLVELNQAVRKKINNILKLSSRFLSVTISPKVQNQQEDFILFEILDNMLKEL